MAKISKLSVYDNETCSFILDSVDRAVVMDKFGISTHTVSQYISRQYKLDGRYIICRQEQMVMFGGKEYSADNETAYIPQREAWMDEWDEMLELFKPFKKKVGAAR